MNRGIVTRVCLAVLAIAGAQCSSSSGSSPTAGSSGGQAAGGAGGSGGQSTTAAGGTQVGTSGGSGGQASAGGAPAGTGGRSGQGGQTTAAGGSAPATGGVVGTGGAPGQGGSEARRDAAAGSGGAGGATSQPNPDALDALAGTGGRSAADAGRDLGTDVAPTDASAVGHPRRVLLGDEGNQKIHLVDLQNPGKSIWSKAISTLRDMQLIGGNRLAVSVQTGYIEIDVDTGETKKQFSKLAGVETIRRLPSGNTVFGGNSDGGITLQELDSQDAPVAGHKMTFTGTNYGPLRLLRRTPQGTFLIGFGAEDSSLAEVNWDKQIVWQMALPNAKHTFQAVRLPDNTIAVATGYGAAILVIDYATKKVLKTLGGPTQPNATAIHPWFYAGFQILPNGNCVVTNWQNHGAGHGNEGIQLLEYDASGALAWQWKQDATLVSSLFNIIVLDGLDTSKLHDDVNGVLAPVAP
jgi:hypothetical protein